MSFGAGTGMSAVLQDDLVGRRKAMERREFMALYGLARLVPSASMTALAVAVGYRLPGRDRRPIVVLLAMILPAFILTVAAHQCSYTMLAGSPALHVWPNLTLMPAALAIVAVSSASGSPAEFHDAVARARSSAVCGRRRASSFFGLNPSLLLIGGRGASAPSTLRPRGAAATAA